MIFRQSLSSSHDVDQPMNSQERLKIYFQLL